MKKTAIILFLTLVLISPLTGAYFYAQKEIKTPLNRSGSDKIILIEKGETAKSIARKLEKEKIIKNHLFFLFYLWQTKQATKLQAGKYALSPKMNIFQAAETIIKGKILDESVEITIPEGLNIGQTAKIIKEKGLIKDEDEFIKIAKPTNFSRFQFIDKSAKTLEGYLFPDTYKITPQTTPKEIVEKILENFQKQTENILSDARRPTMYEIIIMASILEKEVQKKEDMEIVSGILWKRIKINMPLQIDATIAYITGKKTGEITYNDLKIQSPFNTYLNKGLPPSPISNPGLKALNAAANPKTSEYWYYLSKPSGETVFSKTLNEHNANKLKYLK